MRGRARQAATGGFTLAELLVASAMLSAVMVILYSLTHVTLGAWRSLDHGADPYAEARNAVSVFRHEFENLLNDRGTVFEGTQNEITMLVLSEPMDVSESQGAHMMRVRYYSAGGRSQIALMREESLAEGAVPEEGEDQSRLSATRRLQYKRGEEFQLAANLSEFTIRYVWLPAPAALQAGAAPPQMEPVYKDVHRKEWGLPQAVEITYTVFDPEGRRPDLRVRTAFPVRHPGARKNLGALTRM